MKRKIQILALLSVLIISACSQRPRIPQGNQNGGVSHPVKQTHSVKNGGKPSLPNQRNKNNRISKPVKSLPNDNTKQGRMKLQPQEIFEKHSPAVFMIFTTSGIQSFQGSGFFISSAGLAVSNYHVFEGTAMGYEVIKLQDGRQYKIKDVILKDADNDIMIFTIDSSERFPYLQLSNTKPRVGDKAYAIGSPRGLENTFSSGEISQLREQYMIQISVPIDHGSSGGALINEYGEVIGITSAGIDDSGANLNFAVSTDLIRKYIQ